MKFFIASLILALGLKVGVAYGKFYWFDDEGNRKEVALTCDIMEDLKRETVEWAKKLDIAKPECVLRNPEEKPECSTYFMLRTSLRNFWIVLHKEIKENCLEA